MLKKWLIVGALAFVFLPSTARADWLFTPNIGGGFGGNAEGREHLSWGASFGWMGAGVLGWEADLAYTPEFFEGDDDDFDFIENSNVTSFMGNILVGIPIGGTSGGGVRPYVSTGAGVMGFATDHVGFRGDLRYYRALTDAEPDTTFDIDFGDFDFWRASAGLTFRW